MSVIDCGCGHLKHKFKDGEVYILKKFNKLSKIKKGKNYKSYPKPENIIDFNFKPGSPVAVMKKDKKPPKQGKIKMKTYEGENLHM